MEQLGDRGGGAPRLGCYTYSRTQERMRYQTSFGRDGPALGEGRSYRMQGPYRETPSVRRSPASPRGTGASGPHQGAPTPPRRSRQPRPQRSLGPAMMGMVQFTCSLLSWDSNPPPELPASVEIPGPGVADAHPPGHPSNHHVLPSATTGGGQVSSELWC